jgi:hypothetical protein
VPARVRLFLLSFLLLFLELALIRWTSANVIYLSYFTNFVLLASFLGIGLGFLRPRPALFRFAPVALFALVALVYFEPTRLSHPVGKGVIYFGGHTGGVPIWVALPLIFLVVALALMLVAGEAALAFAQLPSLRAYRYDILGSIAGTVVFALMSLAGANPFEWGLVVVAVFLVLGARTLLPFAGLVALLVPLALGSFRDDVYWSPYYAVKLEHSAPLVYHVLVNGIPHQTVEPVALRRGQHADYYYKPYERLHGHTLRDVLIIGAGNGTDVEIALQHHAQRVDAVEIDPRLLWIGRHLNPDHPYADPRVHAHLTDGRAFLERTDRRYDLILFALPDSLTLIAGQSSLRLESYLFTLEALRAARARLTPNGAFAMYNFYRKQWLIDRLGRTLTEAFGHPPCVDEAVGYGAVRGPVADLTIGRAPATVHCASTFRASAAAPAPATDDHPFPYLKNPSVPGFYLLTLALILAVAFASVRTVAGPIRVMRPYADLFCMGAAFLLLETKSVVQFALLFGTTWIVNAFVFLGVLVAVLAAIEVAARLDIRWPLLLYALLATSLAVAWVVPVHSLLRLGFGARLVTAIAVAFVPIFLANLIFAERFRRTASSTTAFGANLLGAMVGGLLEYSALVIGYRNLIVVTAVLYGLALLLGGRALAARGA